jgi:hypothetical protein
MLRAMTNNSRKTDRKAVSSVLPPNKQLQRTVERRRGDDARAPFHYARAPRFTQQRAAAELRCYVA